MNLDGLTGKREVFKRDSSRRRWSLASETFFFLSCSSHLITPPSSRQQGTSPAKSVLCSSLALHHARYWEPEPVLRVPGDGKKGSGERWAGRDPLWIL